MNWNITNLYGLIPLLGGIYSFLLIKGLLPRDPVKNKRMQEWRTRFGPLFKIACPVLVMFGIAQLMGFL